MGILSDIEKNLFESPETLFDYIKAYEEIFPDDCMLDTARALVYYREGNLEQAKDWIQRALIKSPASYQNHYYHALIAHALESEQEAAEACFRGAGLALQFGVNEERRTAIEHFNQLLQSIAPKLSEQEKRQIMLFKRIMNSPPNLFPILQLDEKKWTIFQGDFLYLNSAKPYNDYFCIRPQSYFEGLSYTAAQVLSKCGAHDAYASIPVESWKAKMVQRISIAQAPCMIALSTTAPSQTIQIKNPDGTSQTAKYMLPNTYHYLRLTHPVQISSSHPVIISKPIPLVQNPQKKKLVLCLFQDAISYKILRDYHLEDMPYTKKFFEKGTIFNHAFGTSEWTVPTIPTISTGVYPTRHRITHKNSCYYYPIGIKTISEHFQKAGYFTANITGSIGVTPYWKGSQEGFDHLLYKTCLGYPDGHLVQDALDYMDAFSDTNLFLSLGFYDAHRLLEDLGDPIHHLNITQQLAVDHETLLYRQEKTKSVKTPYIKTGAERYRAMLRHIDRQMKQIYDYITENYKEDEYLVCLYSDHGVTFLSDEEFVLKEDQTNTVMMMRGSGIPAMESEEYINHIDYLPAIAKFTGIDADFSSCDCVLPKTFGGPGRLYTISESIFAGQTYKAVLRNNRYTYTFLSNAETDIDGRIDLSQGFTHKVVDTKTGQDISDPVLLDQLEDALYEHIKYCIKYN